MKAKRTNNINYAPKFKKGDVVVVKSEGETRLTVERIIPEAGGNWYFLSSTRHVYHESELEAAK